MERRIRKSCNVVASMAVNANAIEKAKSEAVYARDNLILRKHDGHAAKVCCVCDKFIMYGMECSVKVSLFKKREVALRLEKGRNHLYSSYNISEETTKEIDNYYTVQCSETYAWLRKLYLSPKSYFIGTVGKDDYAIGTCVECKRSLTFSRTKKEVDDRPPLYAIANGLMIGPTPNELKCLNDVEIAIISLARIDRHVFSIQAGAYKQMIGWHSMYANNITSVATTANWCVENLDDNEIESCENSKSNEFDSDSDKSECCAEDSIFFEEEEEPSRPKFAKIFIILSGPFYKSTASDSKKENRCRLD